MPTFENDPLISKDDGTAVWGESKTWMGVFGKSDSTTGGHGVLGEGVGTGVAGVGKTWLGVYGETQAPASAGAAGVWGDGKAGGDGVKGVANAPGKAAVCGFQLGNNGPGVFGQGSPAGRFEGDVVVTGDLQLAGADLAEHFDVTEDVFAVEPGTVMVLDGADRIRVSREAYDSKVAGVISGAGGYRPGVVLDHRGQRSGRQPLAMVGKAFCKVDASYGPVKCGDLLTTSPTAGHAMTANDADRAFGAALGKAMAPLARGTGLLPVLIALT